MCQKQQHKIIFGYKKKINFHLLRGSNNISRFQWLLLLHLPAVPAHDGVSQHLAEVLVLPAHLVPCPELVKLVVEGLEGLLGPVAAAKAPVALILAPSPLEELLQVALYQVELRREGDGGQSSVAGAEVVDVLDPVPHHQVPKGGVHHGAKEGESLGSSSDLLLVTTVGQSLAPDGDEGGILQHLFAAPSCRDGRSL